MLNESKLKRLIALFEQSDLDELEIQSRWRGLRLRLARNRAGAVTQLPMSTVVHQAPTSPPAAAPIDANATPPAEGAGDDLHSVNSPMVGTFYTAASPDDAPFVQAGDQVKPGQTLCIIEAMKIMNEIEAEVGGEVVEVLVGNGDPVEYNQPLVRIRPA